MRLKILLWLLATVLLTTALSVQAQQPKQVARIGYLGNIAVSQSQSFNIKPFRERLRELGYVEGQNIAVEYRYFEGRVERLPELVAELIRLKCDVIIAGGTEAAEAAKNATKSIPVVMAFSADAVRRGLVADLARPGGNITGLTNLNSELSGKRLELLKDVLRRLSRVAFLWSPTNPDSDYALKETETVARSLSLELHSAAVKGAADLDGAFQSATRGRAEALTVSGGGFFAFHQKRIVELAAKSRLPAVYGNVQFVEAGDLCRTPTTVWSRCAALPSTWTKF